MSRTDDSPADAADIFAGMLRMQAEAARQAIRAFLPPTADAGDRDEALDEWSGAAAEWQQRWLDFHEQQALSEAPVPLLADPAQWLGLVQSWYQQIPMLDPQRQQRMAMEGAELWQQILDQYGAAGDGGQAGIQDERELPRKDRRFADPAWRREPVFALIHQTYLLLAERIAETVEEVEGLGEDEREKLRFATRSMLDAMSPSNFPLTNPVVLERTVETQGKNLATGMERLATDLERGQLTHTDSSAFRLGENIACTPGHVVFETDLYQLIQYSPTTDQVLEIPVVIFPPWINRFYILDLSPKKSFVRWSVERGLTVFMVSWRSADESLAHVEWDDYVRAQIEAIDFVRERLDVPSVHALGYCVAGTTLAATLAILARRGQADRVKSATFLTAQVDFERAGDLKLFVDDTQLEVIRHASKAGYLDGRYMAATFNLLRGSDLIWNYVVSHYLLGEDYPAFDLLHWNSDVTNLPGRWHESYLRDLYRDNRLVVPDAMAADGTPIDLTRITTPLYVQAGREDHIAPPQSVFRMLDHVSGPTRFILAGSGHIAGVVNPPESGKYQFWSNGEAKGSLEDFVSSATQTAGSWWPDWVSWIGSHGDGLQAATGRRAPGADGDPVIEAAPGRYVALR